MLVLGLLILGLLILGILLLVFFVVLFLVLRRRRRFGFCQFALRDEEIGPGIRVRLIELERFLQMLHGIFQVGLAFLDLAQFIPAQRPFKQRCPEVLFDFCSQLGIGFRERFSEGRCRRIEIALGITCCPFVKLERGQAGAAFQDIFVIVLRFLKMSLLIKFLAIGCCCRARQKCGEQETKGQGFRTAVRFAAAFVEEEGGGEQGDAQPERPLVTLDGAAGCPGVDLPLLHFSKARFHDPAHVGGAVLQPCVKAAGSFGNAREHFFVQAGFDELPVRSLDELRAAIFPAHRDKRALRGTDADGENTHRSRCLARGFHGIGTQVFAVGEEHERAAFALALAEGFGRGADRLGDVGAAQRNDVRIEFLNRGEDRRVIDRQRRLQESRARESDEPEAVAFQGVDEVERREFRPFQTARLHVVGQHGTRGVEGDQHIAPFAFGLLDRVAVARLCQRERETGERSQQECAMQATLEKADAARQGGLQARGHKALQQVASAAFSPRKEQRKERNQRQRPEPKRRAKSQAMEKNVVHGNLLQSVWESTVCSRSRPAPAPRNHGKRSRYWRYCFSSNVDFSS